MNTVLREQCAETVPSAPVAGTPNCLFVSTSLTTWKTASPKQFARDFQINDTVYRRLDPEYYAWLRSRMVVGRKATTAGHLSPDAFETLRVRFNAVHEWAVERFGAPYLLDAIRTLDARGYAPPVSETDAPPRAPQRVESPSQEALALVDEIRDRAIELGWTERSLYGAPISPCGSRRRDRGLAGYLKPDDQIGEVSRESIEIILSSGIRQRLYNPDVEQPWVRRGQVPKSIVRAPA